MSRNDLEDLLARMAAVEDCRDSRNSVSWKAHREAETLTDAAMGKIGAMEDIPLLERHLHSRRPDIKRSAELAIQRIKARGGP